MCTRARTRAASSAPGGQRAPALTQQLAARRLRDRHTERPRPVKLLLLAAPPRHPAAGPEERHAPQAAAGLVPRKGPELQAVALPPVGCGVGQQVAPAAGEAQYHTGLELLRGVQDAGDGRLQPGRDLQAARRGGGSAVQGSRSERADRRPTWLNMAVPCTPVSSRWASLSATLRGLLGIEAAPPVKLSCVDPNAGR